MRDLSGVQIVRNAMPRAGGGLSLQMFVLVEEYGDYLACVAWNDGDVGLELVNIAKPYLLQVTPFDGETYNGVDYTYTAVNERTADNGVDDPEDQKITMDYVAGDFILAARGVRGGDQGVVDADGNDVQWYDLNVDARAWAKWTPPA